MTSHRHRSSERWARRRKVMFFVQFLVPFCVALAGIIAVMFFGIYLAKGGL